MAILGFIGGTGPEGMSLALRWAIAGHRALIGSRDAPRAADKAGELRALAPGIDVDGAANADAAAGCEIAIVCVPFAAHAETLADLSGPLEGKLVCDVAVPLRFEKGKGVFVVPVPEGSAAEQARDLLPGSTVVSGFHNLSAESLLDLGHRLEGDAIICGDDAEAKARTIALANGIDGLRGLDGGPLRNSMIVENITALQITMNRIYRTRTHVRILGIPERDSTHG